jgi:hypothetical protein
MGVLSKRVADAFLDLDFAPCRALHLLDDVRRNFQSLKTLLGDGVFNRI